MSREDQVNLNSYANTFISSKFSFQDSNTSVIATPNPSQQPQQASNLSWCAGAHQLTLLHGCCSNSNLEPRWGQLATPYLLWPIGPCGALWPFGKSTSL
ncbi:hypothetical protein O181_095683 [Austropuccinia psidii MF-1]|uniref:Uncharacterized protein n=1 Tax=Austropuccinia psidii MF-1 TaxID=1389203 RepID=A0A9Q3J4A7_9BASI|nr:hypothetical protein [Austropuccinia psidii MF-1]